MHRLSVKDAGACETPSGLQAEVTGNAGRESVVLGTGPWEPDAVDGIEPAACMPVSKSNEASLHAYKGQVALEGAGLKGVWNE